MIAFGPRRWFRLQLPDPWLGIVPGLWQTPSGGRLHVEEVLHSTQCLEPDDVMSVHEAWTENARLHPHETRLEDLGNDVLMIRSYGETASDDFLMAAHFFWGCYLVRMTYRVPMERLNDEDLAEILGILLDFEPHGDHRK